MKNNTERSAHAAKSPEELVEQISHLMSEAEAMLIEPVSEQVSSKISSMKARLHDAQERLADIYGSARKKVVQGAKYTDETIRSHPYESIAVALGIGVLLGALIRRRN